jgi:hypothetical protein
VGGCTKLEIMEGPVPETVLISLFRWALGAHPAFYSMVLGGGVSFTAGKSARK